MNGNRVKPALVVLGSEALLLLPLLLLLLVVGAVGGACGRVRAKKKNSYKRLLLSVANRSTSAGGSPRKYSSVRTGSISTSRANPGSCLEKEASIRYALSHFSLFSLVSRVTTRSGLDDLLTHPPSILILVLG